MSNPTIDEFIQGIENGSSYGGTQYFKIHWFYNENLAYCELRWLSINSASYTSTTQDCIANQSDYGETPITYEPNEDGVLTDSSGNIIGKTKGQDEYNKFKNKFGLDDLGYQIFIVPKIAKIKELM